jgi:hypothetical protein
MWSRFRQEGCRRGVLFSQLKMGTFMPVYGLERYREGLYRNTPQSLNNMKKINLFYWIVTGLFSAFMVFSSISNVASSPEAVQFLGDHLGYPAYIIPFLGVAKILGVIAILVPGFRRIKEWAYAGLFFDLAGGFYSLLVVEGAKPHVMLMLLFMGVLFASYFLWHKKLETKT